MYLNGTNGASTFTTGVTNPEVTAFGGSNLNTALDTDPASSLSTTTAGAASLTIANSTANGKRLVFAFSMTDRENLSISYATQGTASGFNLQTWSYSTDGITFTPFDTTVPASSFAITGVVTLDTLSALDGVETAYIGLTVSGASAASGNNRLDNIQFNTIPEPAAAVLGCFGLLGLLRRRR